MIDIDNINKAVDLYFKENTSVDIAKPKDLMPICIRIGMFNKDYRSGLPLRKILRELDKAERLYLIPSLVAERKEKNIYWSFNRNRFN